MEDFKFKIAGKNYTTKVVEEEGGSLLVTVNGKTYQVEMPGRTPAPKPVIRPAGGVAAAPVAAPAAAAPAAVASGLAERRTSMPEKSLCICIKSAFADAPPSTRRL